MQQEKVTIKEFIRLLNIIQIAMAFGIVSFASVLLVLYSQITISENPDLSRMMQYVVPVLALLCVIISNIIFRKKAKAFPASASLSEKMKSYRDGFIIFLALIEAPAILSLVAFFMTGKWVYMAFAGALFLYLFKYRPLKMQIASNLMLSMEETEMLKNDETLV